MGWLLVSLPPEPLFSPENREGGDNSLNRSIARDAQIYPSTNDSRRSTIDCPREQRVRRIVGGVETWMIYGLGGELLAEYPANGAVGSPQKEYGYRDGQLLIVAQTAPVEIRWLVADHLGSPRINVRGTGADGGSLASVTRHDYLPFGEELISGVGIRGSGYSYEPPADGVRQKFDGYERDLEIGLDYAGARYYAPIQGRFASLDPVFFQKEMPTDPQRFNLYSLTRNNPLKFKDPNGEAIELIGSDEQRKKALELVRQGVGSRAGAYLYEQAVLGKDGSTRYFIGIKNHSSGEFGRVNKVSGFIEKLVLDSKVAQVSIASRGEKVNAYGSRMIIGQGDNQAGPGWTYVHPTGEAKTWILDPSARINKIWALYPGNVMEGNGLDVSEADPSDVLMHEFGHIYASWFQLLLSNRGSEYDPYSPTGNGDFAVQLENMSRRLKDPSARLRIKHSPMEEPMTRQQALPYNP